MRVVSGSAKGRPLKPVPGMGTRPTTDKVKEAIFSMIGPFFDGGTALDLFAGTGGLAIEALSRGMDKAIFIDMDPKSIETVRANLKATKLEGQAEVYRNEAERALKVLAKREVSLDVIFLDPPYRMKNGDKLMDIMHEQGMLKDGATIVLEHESGYEYPSEFGLFSCIRHAVYGETAVSIYKYNDIEAALSEDEAAGEEDQDVRE
ncbi:16S rRNA (guanine(966)-N(2))-methyltransferase RsmD [Paenibacillus sp. KQZ6P-2]|uniref:16S rRNA (Guanine(966)-N(2))-methyltransferase RsmD n=1 Tax=Paenibacillus mangrovi TaxID=2931978 RepID=A0A9X1WKT9_9BACL|nr:16S rRNA (guanine(966)-N(2))-methyltransferase RsmD [Paenibacillus mangrovi]MCJ8010551.1 16S rRNA (guanine(966)-N(2))-methyltransferase RsmD [Paenibacillus mangrovi]